MSDVHIKKSKSVKFIKSFVLFKGSYFIYFYSSWTTVCKLHCRQSSPNITEFMIQKGFGPEGYSLLEGYYVSRAIDIISKTGKTLMLWQDPLDNGVVVRILAIYIYLVVSYFQLYFLLLSCCCLPWCKRYHICNLISCLWLTFILQPFRCICHCWSSMKISFN